MYNTKKVPVVRESVNKMNFQFKRNCLTVLCLILALALPACTDAPDNKNADHPIQVDVQSENAEAKDTLLRATKDDTNTQKKNNSEKIQFEKITGIQLPLDAQMINFSNNGGIDEITKAKVKMTTSDFEKWVSDFALKLSDFNDERRYLLGQNEDWWDPLKPKTLPTAQVNFENGMTLNIGYNPLKSGIILIYLVFHSK